MLLNTIISSYLFFSLAKILVWVIAIVVILYVLKKSKKDSVKSNKNMWDICTLKYICTTAIIGLLILCVLTFAEYKSKSTNTSTVGAVNGALQGGSSYLEMLHGGAGGYH